MTIRPRRRIAAVLALGTLTFTPAVMATGSSVFAGSAATTSIKVGSTGSTVESVQKALVKAGYLDAAGVDGVFGNGTKEAVAKFQKARGLNATGAVDAATSLALGVTSSPYVGLKSGSKGENVTALQNKLNSIGYSAGAADGVYGASTAYAVKMFQKSLGYMQTGDVNAATAAAIEAHSGGSGTVEPKPTENTSAPETTAPTSTTPGTTTPAATTTGPANGDFSTYRMSLGSHGDQVKAVQGLLIKMKYDVVGGADGYYGAMSANAMRAFQKDNGLAVDAIVGKHTAAMLQKAAQGKAAGSSGGGSSSTPSGDLKTGSTGAAVKTLQQRLLDVGVPLHGGVDGIFGPATAKAVRLFQGWNGINQTGVVDAKTAQALASAKTTSTNSGDTKPSGDIGYAVYGENSARVSALQNALVKAGVTVKGGVDGVFGSGTAAAVMSFQRSKSLSVTGVVNKATADKLGLKPTNKPSGAKKPKSDSGSGYIKVFPVQGWCGYSDTWGAPRSGGRSHIGTDIIAAEGKLLYAVNDGVIEKIYSEASDRLSGNGVRLRMADGTYAFYAHMAGLGPGIKVGTRVTAGQVVGTVGTTGNAYTPHLHFELHPHGGAAVDPYPLLKAVDACNVTAPR